MAFIFFLFVLFPLTLVLAILWLATKKKIYGKIICYFWLGLFGLLIFAAIASLFTNKMELESYDYVGEYIIDRDYFPGKQADWQYNTFRFEIKENDSIYFYITDKEKIVRRFRGITKTTHPHLNSVRLIIEMEQPTYHIIKSNPTTYRHAWSFYLVFHSDYFNNVYFKKGKWKLLEN